MSKRIKVLAYCDSPSVSTGFATVSKNILMGLHNTGLYDITVLGVNYWGIPHSFPFPIFPVGFNEQKDPYGRQKVCGMIMNMDFDVLFFLQDTFILDFLPELHTALRSKGKKFKSIVYYPIDSPSKKEWIDNVKVCDYVVAYSQYGKDITLGFDPSLKDISVIPHGVNFNDFHPVNKQEVENFRRQYFGPVADKWIVTNVSRNQQRKDIPRCISAFKEFKKQVPNSVLYIHAAFRDQGGDLKEVVDAFGLSTSKDVIFPERFSPNQGYPIHVLNMIYNASDCVISTTTGEGFGLSIDSKSKVLCESGIKKVSDVVAGENIILNGEKLKVVGSSTYNVENKDIHKLITYGNRTLVGSEDHHVPVYMKGDVRLGDIEVGDKVLIDKMVFKDEIKDRIDVLDYINIDNVEYDDVYVWKKMGFSSKTPHSISTIMESTGETKHVVENAIKVYLCEKKMNSERVDIVVDYLESIEYARPLNKINRFVPFTSEFARLLGYYVAEGDSAGGRGISFSFHTKEILYHREICMYTKFLFGVDSVIRTRGNKTEVGTSNAVLAEFFSNICGLHSKNKKVPDIVFNGSSDVIREFLLGCFNGDGCYTSNMIQYTTTSEILHYQILYLLSGFNIFGNTYLRDTGAFNISVSGMDRIKLAKLFNLRYLVNSNVFREKNITDLGNCWAVPVISNKTIEFDGTFSDLAIEDKHYFVANTIVVHNSWLEGMATKTPVIMPVNTMLPEFITNDTGWLYKSGGTPNLYHVFTNDNEVIRPLADIDDLVKTMVEVYNNKAEVDRRVENAYSWVKSSMGWQEYIVPMWLKIFKAASKQEESVAVVDDVKNKIIEAERF